MLYSIFTKLLRVFYDTLFTECILCIAIIHPPGTTEKEYPDSFGTHRRFYIDKEPEFVQLKKQQTCYGGHQLQPGHLVLFLGNAYSCFMHRPPAFDELQKQYQNQQVTMETNPI